MYLYHTKTLSHIDLEILHWIASASSIQLVYSNTWGAMLNHLVSSRLWFFILSILHAILISWHFCEALVIFWIHWLFILFPHLFWNCGFLQNRGWLVCRMHHRLQVAPVTSTENWGAKMTRKREGKWRIDSCRRRSDIFSLLLQLHSGIKTWFQTLSNG